MRLPISIALIALLGACQVTKDDTNDSVSVTYNEDVAADAASDVGNVVENTADAISNDVAREGDKIENRVDAANDKAPPPLDDDNQ
jgi:hypothetical protein